MNLNTEINIEIDADDLMNEIDLSNYIDIESQVNEIVFSLLEGYAINIDLCDTGQAFEDAVTKVVRKVMSNLWKPQEGEATHAPSND